ncbi:MAG: filamentous hemagglutinin N-terminal domain-containing protein (plasmid) [Nodularia sp. CChRGM 3473]
MTFAAIGSGITLWANGTFAQITPDVTLPNNSSVTVYDNTSTINGGSRAGNNLFHSFKDFSVPSGSTVFFNNAANIQNIISRVTGESVSNIDGMIRANSTANLFLINSNGIIFGSNARIDIGGSFVASTASSLRFTDGTLFSTKPLQDPSLLTINTPLGLQFGRDTGKILVQGDGQGLRSTPDLIDTNVGLRVQPNQTLALVGGDVILEGGTLKTAGGRIELGSIAEPGLVNLSPTDKGWTLNYNRIQNFGDIQLSQQAAVDASGKGSGDIQIQGRKISLTGGSQIESSTLGEETGGTLLVTGIESVDLSGVSPEGIITGLGAQVYPEASGTGGDLTIKTGELTVRNGAQVTLYNLGAGSGGNLAVSANLVELNGASPDGFLLSGLYTSALPGATGDSGDLTIKTGRLLVKDGAQISSGSLGAGSGGDLTVLSRNSVEVTGISSINNTRFPSAIGTVAFLGGTSNGGNLTLETQKLIIQDGALISTATLGQGAGGTLSIKANSVELSNPSLPNFRGLSGLSSRSRGDGKAGNLVVEAELLSVQDGSRITTENTGNGSAGSIYINGNLISLDKKSSITAATASGEGGNIFLDSQYLQLRRGSAITATAGNSGNGGNIKIDTDILAALENSEITANAFEGRGGNIKIDTKALFLSPDSRITASSERGVDGTVQINSLIRNHVQTTTEPEAVQADTKIASVCQGRSGTGANTFVVTGFDGLMPSASNLPSHNPIWQDNSLSVQADNASEKLKSIAQETTPILEAQALVKKSNGRVFLTTNSRSVSPDTALSASLCSGEFNHVGTNKL